MKRKLKILNEEKMILNFLTNRNTILPLKVNKLKEAREYFPRGVFSHQGKILSEEEPVEKQGLKENDVVSVFKEDKIVGGTCVQPFLLGVINGYKCLMFFDSGADTSCITMDTIEKLGLQNLIEPVENVKISGVGEGVITGRIKTKIWIGNESLDLEVMITEFGLDKNIILIGRDVMFRYGICLDFADRSIRIKRKNFLMLNGDEIDNFIIPLKLINNQNVKLILENIINHPTDEKFKILKTSSKYFQQYLSSPQDCLKELGFNEMTDVYHYQGPIEKLSSYISV